MRQHIKIIKSKSLFLPLPVQSTLHILLGLSQLLSMASKLLKPILANHVSCHTVLFFSIPLPFVLSNLEETNNVTKQHNLFFVQQSSSHHVQGKEVKGMANLSQKISFHIFLWTHLLGPPQSFSSPCRVKFQLPEKQSLLTTLVSLWATTHPMHAYMLGLFTKDTQHTTKMCISENAQEANFLAIALYESRCCRLK